MRMMRAFRRHSSRFKALVCIGLMLNAQFWVGGCEQSMVSFAATAGEITIPLAPGHALLEALGDSGFQDASALVISPADQSFRLVYQDATREVIGRYSGAGGAVAILGINVRRGEMQVALSLNSAKQITTITTSQGHRWERPSAWNGAGTDAGSSGVDAYVASNAELFDLARAFDRGSEGVGPAQPPADGSGLHPDEGTQVPPKSDSALFAPLFILLGVLVAVIIPISGAAQGLFVVTAVVAVVQNILSALLPAEGEDGGDAPSQAVPGDCNANGIDDAADIVDGTSEDCNANATPDDCEDDADADGVPDECDACPGLDDREDADLDGVPDGCDPCPADILDDSDDDGSCDSDDTCPRFDDTADADGDGTPDGCDPCPDDNPNDSDGDRVCDSTDICPGFDDLTDADSDGFPDGCDPCPLDNPDDTDGDGVCDTADLCPGFDDGADADSDGVPDGCDVCPDDNPDDTDGDGVCDSLDPCPLDNPDDTDGDGVCDSLDPCPDDNPDDSDGDGVCDSADICPGSDDNVDTDGDGTPNGCDACPDDNPDDTDGDGVCDSLDPCPFDNPDDTDGDGVCDSADICHGFDDNVDTDGDGTPDGCDAEACCLQQPFDCVVLTETECTAQNGAFQGFDSSCGAIACDGISVSITIPAEFDRSWVYESIPGSPDVDRCQVTCTASIDFDPWQNSGYSFVWTITPPGDADNTNFVISGDGTDQITFTSPHRPAYSPSQLPYVVQCVVTGDDVAIQGLASFNLDVRLLGDVNDNFCVDAVDEGLINGVEDGSITDPELVAAADVDCDGDVDGTDANIAFLISVNADGNGSGNCD